MEDYKKNGRRGEEIAMNLTKKQVKAFLEILSSDNVHPILTQASIELYNDVTHLVATDSYKLVAIPVNGVSDMIGKRISREDIVKWYKLASNKDRFTDENVRELATLNPEEHGKYPKWQDLVPTGEKTAFTQTILNVNYLMTIQNLFEVPGLTLEFYGDKFGPVVVRNNGMLGLIMPLKS